MKLAAAELKTREQFVLLDEQNLAYELVRHAVEKARRSDFKEVIIVTGGPGSGKSAIALSLLGEFYRLGWPAIHATGSQSFTETMRRVIGKGSTSLKNLFKYFNNFMSAERNSLDVIICDEPHRVREISSNQYTPAKLRSTRPQLDELISAARVPVFLLDEHQVVRPGEIGTVADIRSHAASLNLPVRQVDLDAQFRCGGSRKYEAHYLVSRQAPRDAHDCRLHANSDHVYGASGLQQARCASDLGSGGFARMRRAIADADLERCSRQRIDKGSRRF